MDDERSGHPWRGQFRLPVQARFKKTARDEGNPAPPFHHHHSPLSTKRDRTMQVYYVHQDGHQSGPFTRSQLQSMWEQGIVNASATFWTEGMANWASLSDLCEGMAPYPESHVPVNRARVKAKSSAPRWLSPEVFWHFLKRRESKRTRIIIASVFLLIVAASAIAYFAPFDSSSETTMTESEIEAAAIRSLMNLAPRSGSGSGGGGTFPCGDCSARGWSIFPACPACRGNGTIVSPSGFAVACNRCGGRGGSTCSSCGGSGRVTPGGF